MNKSEFIWDGAKTAKQASVQFALGHIKYIVGIPIDHSFLRYKNGYAVNKISMKKQKVIF